jgi:hypothetical protein
MTVGELEQRMSTREFLWWKALATVEHDEAVEAS